MYQTNQYEGMIAETVSMRGHNGDVINAYVARPLGAGPFPGMVVIHHAPGWDEWYRECTRRFAHHGYVSISMTRKLGIAAHMCALIRDPKWPLKLCGATLISKASAIAAILIDSRMPFQATSMIAASTA